MLGHKISWSYLTQTDKIDRLIQINECILILTGMILMGYYTGCVKKTEQI